MTKEQNSNSILPPPERKVITYDKPQKEHNPPIFEGFQTWSDQVKVQSLEFDRFGHLWGCGPGGVIRWIITPTEIKYKVWQSEHGIAGNDTQCLLIASDGRIVCGHASGWISIFQNENWKVVNSGTYFPIRSLATAPDGAIFACTDIGLFDIDTEELDSNIPAPPISAGTAFDRFWIGTESGLFFKDNTGWQLLDMDKPFRVVKAMRYNGNRLWFSGFDGAAYLDGSGAVTRIPIKEPVYALAPVGDKVLLATDDGVFVYTESSNSLQRMSHYPSRAVVVKDHEVIQSTSDNLLLVDHKNRKERWLLPERENLPGEVQRVFEAAGVTYIQCVDGSIWDDSKMGWTKIADSATSPLSSIVNFQGNTYFAFNAKQGIGRFVEGVLKRTNEISYALTLIAQTDRLLGVTIEETLVTYNGSEWSSNPLNNARQTILLTSDGKLVKSDGLYRLDENLKDCPLPFENPCVAASVDVNTGEIIIVQSGLIVRINQHLSIESVKVDSSIKFTSVCKYNDLILAGTQNGILVVSDKHQSLDAISSGLADNFIIQMKIVGNKLWTFTNNGLSIFEMKSSSQ
jgi:ligand-binding sensor domain-containing protein